jgi:hypothetical protein
MISNELRFHFTIRMMWKTWNVENCISVWKSEHVWCKSRKHKHVHGTKRWTKNPWAAYCWAPCNKTIGLRTPWHYKTENPWATYPWAPWNEKPLGCVLLGTMKRKTLGMRTPGHRATRPLGCVSRNIMKWKNLGLRTLGHHETKDRWAAYPSAPKWDENEWLVCIAWCWCVTYFKMIS